MKPRHDDLAAACACVRIGGEGGRCDGACRRMGWLVRFNGLLRLRMWSRSLVGETDAPLGHETADDMVDLHRDRVPR